MSKPTVDSAQITDNPSNRKSVKLPVVSMTDTILGILQDVLQMGEYIPYLEGIAGVLRSVIKIRQVGKRLLDIYKSVQLKDRQSVLGDEGN